MFIRQTNIFQDMIYAISYEYVLCASLVVFFVGLTQFDVSRMLSSAIRVYTSITSVGSKKLFNGECFIILHY